MEAPVYSLYPRDSFFSIGLAVICPHVFSIMVSVVITKVTRERDNPRVLRNFASIVLKCSAEVVKIYSARTIIEIEYSLPSNSGSHLLNIYSLVCAWIKVLRISPVSTLRFWESAMISNRRTENPLSTVVQVDHPRGSTWLPSQIRRALEVRSVLTPYTKCNLPC